ncbi:hypothetical protein HDU88_007053 [Geranomyces variabilis]|nr:hypothetical protein HDU88_007053 [Geranomyces variabilis]
MSLPTSLDIDLLNSYVSDKRLKCQSHPTEDLIIWNYSEVVQFKKLWDDITLQCRGLITDTAGNVVARSFPKFFNEDERSYEATSRYTVMAKVDGSLGILFYHRNRWVLASRGSFTSSQAGVGMEILLSRYEGLLDVLDKRLSYNFEIIYPENRIVVNYGDERKLIFLTAFRPNGEEVFAMDGDDSTVPNKVSIRDLMAEYGVIPVTQFDQASIAELKARDVCNEEGYVVRFENGTRIKIKFAQYVALHRLVGNINETMLLQEFTAGKTFLDVCEQIPDEFMKWAERVWSRIETKYATLQAELEATFATAKEGTSSRGEFARKVLSLKNRRALFDRYEGKNPREKLLRLIDVNDLTDANSPDGGGELELAPAGGMSGKRAGPPQQASPVLVILFGLSASDKSNFAQRWVTSHVNSIVINRDSLSLSLFASESACLDTGRKGSVERRKLLDALELDMIRNALLRGVSVLVDNTAYLSLDQIRKLLQAVPSGCSAQVRIFDVPVADSVDRLTDGEPARTLDLTVIDKQAGLWEANSHLVESFVAQELAQRSTFLVQNSELPPCYVFDIDGTLAISGNRNQYDESKVHLDAPNPDVVDLARTLHGAGMIVHICTGRTETCRQATETWLAGNGILYFTLLMREVGDTRPDYLVKQEMWTRIAEANYIRMLVDDRGQVVHHARSLGLTVAQVAYGEF